MNLSASYALGRVHDPSNITRDVGGFGPPPADKYSQEPSLPSTLVTYQRRTRARRGKGRTRARGCKPAVKCQEAHARTKFTAQAPVRAHRLWVRRADHRYKSVHRSAAALKKSRQTGMPGFPHATEKYLLHQKAGKCAQIQEQRLLERLSSSLPAPQAFFCRSQ